MDFNTGTIPAVEIVEARAGVTVLRLENGEIVTREGTRNWRNNNPGNLEYNSFTRGLGAIGTDGRFAIFPTLDVGFNAMTGLLSGPTYRDRTIQEAIARYAPSFENDVGSYVGAVTGAVGVPASTRLRDLTSEQRSTMVRAMVQHEGWEIGSETGGSTVGPLQFGPPMPPMPQYKDVPTPGPTATVNNPAAWINPPNPVARPSNLSSAPRDPFGVGYAAPAQSVSVPPVGLLTSLMDPAGTQVMPRDELNFAAGMRSDPEGNYHRLSDDMQQLITRAYASMPEELRNKVELTSTYRPDRFQNHLGEAIDIRTRNLTNAEQAIVAGAFAQAGAVGLGVYDSSYTGGAHIHVDLTGRFQSEPGNRKRLPTAVQPLSMSARQNPHLGPVYAAMEQTPGERSSVMLDLARRDLPTLPNPVPRPPSLPARREETTPRLSETYGTGPSTGPSPSTFNPRPSYPSGLPAARPQSQSIFSPRPAPVISGLADAPRNTQPPTVSAPILSRTSDQVRDAAQWPGGSTVTHPTARISGGPPSSVQPPTRPRKSPDQFQYQTRTRQVPNPAYHAPSAPAPTPPRTPSISAMAQQYGLRALETADPLQVPSPTIPGPARGQQFGNVPNPMARPHGLPRSPGPQVPRRRVGLVPSPIIPPNAPRRQGFRGQGFVGLGDWAQGFMAPRVADSVSHTMRRASRVQQAGPPMQLAPPQMQLAQANQGGFLQSLLSTQPTNPSFNGRAQGPWNSTGGEGGFVW